MVERVSHGRAIKQSSESMVTGVQWEHGRWKSEHRCYQTHTSHTPVCLFIIPYSCKPPFLTSTNPFFTYLQLSQWKIKEGKETPVL